MILSLKKSKDMIEQLYGEEILENFPNYEKFWEEFIGNPNAAQVEPYMYCYPDDMTVSERKKIENSYLKIQMAHYTLFCHLAGAHFQKKELETAQGLKDHKEKYFRCCEHFEAAYMHLGSVFYVLETLWCTVLRLIGQREGKKGLGKMTSFLENEHKNDLAARLKKIDENMMNRRHLPVHYSRVFVTWHQGDMYVPINVQEKMLWSQGYETNEWRRSDRQLSSDLIQIEKLVNDLHEVLIEKCGTFLAGKSVVVDREGGKN
jgi:hypothetical protein